MWSALYNRSWSTEQHLACSGVQPSPTSCPVADAKLINVRTGGTARYSGLEMALLGLQERALHHAKWQHGLFALGPHYAYGRLLATAFSFDEVTVRAPTRAVLAEALSSDARAQAKGNVDPGSVWIAVHMRHRDSSMLGNESVPTYVAALRNALSRRRGKRCVVLLASDRRASLRAFVAYTRATGLDCRFVASARGAAERDNSFQSGQTGEDTGVGAIRDLHLLSHADVLIDVFGSTYALLIAEMATAAYFDPATLRHDDVLPLPRRAEPPRIVWCDEPGKSGACGPELPLLNPENWWHLSFSRWPHADFITSPVECPSSGLARESRRLAEGKGRRAPVVTTSDRTESGMAKPGTSLIPLLLREGPPEKNSEFLTVSLANGGWHLQYDRGYYNSSTGWLMKAMYNCQGDERKPPATAWVHLPDRKGKRTWNQIVQELGGHRHIAEAAMMHTAECGQQRTHILILGNSFMRQVFEAIANRFRKYVTAGVLNAYAPKGYGRAATKLKPTMYAKLSDFKFLSLPMNGSMNPGCHGWDVAKYYKQEPPPSLQRCEDSVAWFELNQTLRIYYIFRPWAITEGVHGILQKFGINIHAVDVLVCNENCGQTGTQVRNELMRSCRGSAGGKQFIDFGPVRANLQAQLRRDANSTYGATNARSHNDGHPCMPGLPDDEVDILFAAIATGRNCTFLGFASERDAEYWHS